MTLRNSVNPKTTLGRLKLEKGYEASPGSPLRSWLAALKRLVQAKHHFDRIIYHFDRIPSNLAFNAPRGEAATSSQGNLFQLRGGSVMLCDGVTYVSVLLGMALTGRT